MNSYTRYEHLEIRSMLFVVSLMLMVGVFAENVSAQSATVTVSPETAVKAEEVIRKVVGYV